MRKPDTGAPNTLVSHRVVRSSGPAIVLWSVCMRSTLGSAAAQHTTIQRARGRMTRKRQCQVHFGEQIPDHLLHTLATAEGQPPQIGPAEKHRPSAERERFDHVGAAANSAVEQ